MTFPDALRHRRRVRSHLRRLQYGLCAYCLAELLPVINAGAHPRRTTFDHIVPVVAGGQLRLGNTVLACSACNNLKGARPLADFLRAEKKRPTPALCRVLLATCPALLDELCADPELAPTPAVLARARRDIATNGAAVRAAAIAGVDLPS